MTPNGPLRVLVVDDTVVYRKAVSDLLSEFPDVEVVGTANNGKIAMSKIASLRPDILTLDIDNLPSTEYSLMYKEVLCGNLIL